MTQLEFEEVRKARTRLIWETIEKVKTEDGRVFPTEAIIDLIKQGAILKDEKSLFVLLEMFESCRGGKHQMDWFKNLPFLNGEDA